MRAHKQIDDSRDWEVQTLEQKVKAVDALIADLTEMAVALEAEIRHAESEAKVSDVQDLSYPTAAQAFRTRLRNIRETLNLLSRERNGALEALRSASASARTLSRV